MLSALHIDGAFKRWRVKLLKKYISETKANSFIEAKVACVKSDSKCWAQGSCGEPWKILITSDYNKFQPRARNPTRGQTLHVTQRTVWAVKKHRSHWKKNPTKNWNPIRALQFYPWQTFLGLFDNCDFDTWMMSYHILRYTAALAKSLCLVILCGNKVLRGLLFKNRWYFVFCGKKFLRLYKTCFSCYQFLRFSQSRV